MESRVGDHLVLIEGDRSRRGACPAERSNEERVDVVSGEAFVIGQSQTLVVERCYAGHFNPYLSRMES